MELNAIIPVRSERQAMDWSLVLVSQGIETAIEQAPESGAWRLRVSEDDQARAWTTLRLYWHENRRRRWQRPLKWTGLLFDGRAAFWFGLIAAIYLVDALGFADFKGVGMMDTLAVRKGEWWRLFTAVMLHADVGHLAGNAATGFLLLGLAMGSYGAGAGLLAAYLAGAGGNVAAFFLAGEAHRSLGASGMVLGALGLLAVHSFSQWRFGATPRDLAGRSLMAGVLLLVLLGMSPKTDVDVLAHVAGFVSGAILGLGWGLLPERARCSPWLDRSTALGCAALVALTWMLASRGKPI